MTELTDRQRQILCLVAKGYQTNDIAEELCLSGSTIQDEMTKVLAELGVESRFTAVFKALKLGLLRLEEIDV